MNGFHLERWYEKKTDNQEVEDQQKMNCERDDGNDISTMVHISLTDERDDEEFVAVESAVWMKFNHFTLMQKDQEILSNSAGWVNDSIIQVAQSLLKKKTVSWFWRLSKYTFRADTQLCCREERIYPDSPHWSWHWMTVSTLGLANDSEAMVYDSLSSTLSLHIQKQIAALLHTTARKIKVNMMDIHLQAGTSDCGLFAIASATALAHGIQPGSCSFNQSIY